MATEKRLIRPNLLIEELTGMKKIDLHRKKRGLIERWVRDNGYDILIQLVKHFPTVDAAPVVHGEWIDGRPYVNSRWKVCSVCHCSGPEPQGGFPYCPNCGAKMDGGKVNEM